MAGDRGSKTVLHVATVKRQFVVASALLLAAALVTFLLYATRPDTDISEPVYVPITVDVVVAEKETIRIPMQAQGTVSPLQQTTLLAEVQGRIVEASETFNVGGFVNAGDVLLRIDPRDYQARLARAEAALRSAESELLQERGRADVARRAVNARTKRVICTCASRNWHRLRGSCWQPAPTCKQHRTTSTGPWCARPTPR